MELVFKDGYLNKALQYFSKESGVNEYYNEDFAQVIALVWCEFQLDETVFAKVLKLSFNGYVVQNQAFKNIVEGNQ